MKTFLIHTDEIGGHQLEYIHHLYEGALSMPLDTFYFILPKRFEIDSSRFEWPHSDNIRIIILKKGEEAPRNCNLLKKGWLNSKVIGRYAKEFKVTDVITISIMAYLPFLPLFLNKNVRFSGIVYRIYLYEWKDESISMKIQDAVKYWIMSRCKVFHRIFMCNDSASAYCLNRIFKTDKFRFMPDPVASLRDYEGNNVREKLGIADDKVVLLHPGGMNPYKNTIGILRALDMLEKDCCNKLAVIFAGQVTKEIKADFDILYNKVGQKIQLLLFNGYLPFEYLADLFVSCDYVLVPYNVKSQSSGIVGHAAYYGKPVIAMGGGVIGKMVRKWHLGSLLYRSSDVSLYQYLCSLKYLEKYDTVGNHYLEEHSIEMFNKTLLGEIDD